MMIVSVMLSFLLFSICEGQQRENSSIVRIVSEKSECEITEKELYLTAISYEENSTKGSSLLIIGRPAKNEKRLFNSKRIRSIVAYFIRYGLEKEALVFAEGEPSDEIGIVEIYVNGVLTVIFQSKPKNGICTSCCDTDFKEIERLLKKQKKKVTSFRRKPIIKRMRGQTTANQRGVTMRTDA